jgi:hypothetical protein
MTRNIIVVLSVTSLLTPALFTGIGKAADGQLELSIEEGIVMVLENNLDIVIERISPKVEEARIRKEEGAFDRTIFASLEWEDSTTPLNARSTVAAGGRTEVESEAYTADMGLKSLTRLGTEYTLEVSDKWRANTFNFFDFEHDTRIEDYAAAFKGLRPGGEPFQD